jgi:hypothetical protein
MPFLFALLLIPAFALGQGITRVTPGGVLPSRTNYALQSATMSTTTSATSPWALSGANLTTVAGAPFSPGATWAEVTSTSTSGSMYQVITTPSVPTFVAYSWVAKASGTGYAGVRVSCGAGTPSSCYCRRSDGGTCTGSTVSTNYCLAEVADLGTTTIRLTAVVTCSAAHTSPNIALIPGRYGVDVGTTRFSAAQVEAAVISPSKLCVTTTAVRTCR